jgi:hypothetical protein
MTGFTDLCHFQQCITDLKTIQKFYSQQINSGSSDIFSKFS